MTKKYFKYIVFSLLATFAFLTNAKATSCQYDIPVNGQHLYLRFDFNNKWDSSSKLSCCLSDTAKAKGFQCSMPCDSNSIDYSTHSINGVTFTMPGGDISKKFSGDTCQQLSFSTNGADITIKEGGAYSTDPDVIYDNVDPNSDNPTSPTVQESRIQIDGVQIIGKKNANGDMTVTADGVSCKFVSLSSVLGAATNIETAADLLSFFATAVGEVQAAANGDYCIISNDVSDILFDQSRATEVHVTHASSNGIKRYIISQYDGIEAILEAMGKNVFIDPGSNEDKNEAQYKKLSDICDKSKGDERVKNVLKAIGYFAFVAKILVPLGLIIFGTIDFGKAMVYGEDAAMSKVLKLFFIKLIAAIVIFLAPTIIYFLIKKINDTPSTDYQDCATCIFEPKNCK